MANSIIIAICKRSYVPLRNDNDPVLPDNLGAIKLGLMSHGFEDKNDPDRAALFMGPNLPEQTGRMAGAIDLLDKEREETEQAEVPVFNVRSDFGAGQIVNVR